MDNHITNELIKIVAKTIKDYAASVELSETLILTFDNFDKVCKEVANNVISCIVNELMW